MKPPSENTTAVSSTEATIASTWWTDNCVKNNATAVTTAPTTRPRNTPPHTYPSNISQPGSGDTISSSMCLPNLAPKKDDTTLAYELLMTCIMIRPGAMYCR